MKISSGLVLQALGSAVDTVTAALENPKVVEAKNLIKESMIGGLQSLGVATQAEVTRLEAKVQSLEEALKGQQIGQQIGTTPGLHTETPAPPPAKPAQHSSGAV